MKVIIKYFILVMSVALGLWAATNADNEQNIQEDQVQFFEEDKVTQSEQAYGYTLSQAGDEIDKYLDKQINKANLPISDSDKKAIITEIQKQLIISANPATLTLDELTLRKAKKNLKKQLKKIFPKEYATYSKRKENFFSKLSYLEAFKQVRNSISSQLQIYIVKTLGVTDKTKAKDLLDSAMRKISTRLYNAIHEIDAIKTVTIDKKEVVKLTQDAKLYIAQKNEKLKQPQEKKAASIKYLRKFKKTKKIETPKKAATPTQKKGRSKKYYGNGAGPTIRKTHEYYQEEKVTTPSPVYKKRQPKPQPIKLQPTQKKHKPHKVVIGDGDSFGVKEVEELSDTDRIGELVD